MRELLQVLALLQQDFKAAFKFAGVEVGGSECSSGSERVCSSVQQTDAGAAAVHQGVRGCAEGYCVF